MSKSLLAAVAATVAMLSGAMDAHATFEVCNRSNERAEVSIGYNDSRHGWTSEGWWEVGAGECVDLITEDLDERYYYIYATGNRGGVWSGPKSQKGGFFCTSTRKFTYHNRDFERRDEIDCERGKLQTKKFIEVDTKDANEFTFNLRN